MIHFTESKIATRNVSEGPRSATHSRQLRSLTHALGYDWLNSVCHPILLILLATFLFHLFSPTPTSADENKHIVLIVGAPGEKKYGELFEKWAKRFQKHANDHKTPITTIGIGKTETDTDDRKQIQQTLQKIAKSPPAELWVVMIGHGTFDGTSAKLNLRGPDCTAAQMNDWLNEIKTKTVIVNCASTSGIFVNKLSAPQRIIITSTKSAYQYNFSRFGEYFSSAITDQSIDLDKDGGISLLEVFLAASKRTAEFYKSKSQLATEHALLDDNGDSVGTPADWFTGVRVTKKAKDPKILPDGFRANQVFLIPNQRDSKLSAEAIKKRNELELQIEQLRAQKPQHTEDDYYAKLEPLMLELAKIYVSPDTTDQK